MGNKQKEINENKGNFREFANKNLEFYKSLISCIQKEDSDKELNYLLKNSLKYNNFFDNNILSIQVQYQDNEQIIQNLLKFILKENNITNNKDEIVNNIINTLNSILKNKKETIRNEFYFLSKLNLLLYEAEVEKKLKNALYQYPDKGKILISEHDDIEDFEHNSDDEINLNYSKCDIFHIKKKVIQYLLIKKNKLYLTDEETIYIYNFINKKMELITQRKINLDKFYLLNNKNILINKNLGESYFYILHIDKLNIIDRIPKIYCMPYKCDEEYSYFKELSDKSLASLSDFGLSIYKKIDNNYIFSKIIYTVSRSNNIFQFHNDYFIIWEYFGIYKYSMKDYSLEKFLCNDRHKLEKINNNIAILYKKNICQFLDLNQFEIIKTIKINEEIERIYPLKKNKFLIIYKEAKKEYDFSLCKLNESEDDFIYEYNIKVPYCSLQFYNICDMGNGFIFYKMTNLDENESIIEYYRFGFKD